MRSFSALWLAALLGGAAGLTACSGVPTSGPTTAQVVNSANTLAMSGIQIVDVNEDVARQLLAERRSEDFARTLGNGTSFQRRLGLGDTVEVSIWEAPPATLFGASPTDIRSGGPSNARVTVLPEQMVDGDGNINVPFAGQIKVAGRTRTEVEREITGRLKGKANQPQVLVRLSRNVTSYVTVVGDVASSTRMPL